MRALYRSLTAVSALAALAAGGCGLVDPDIADFPLQIRDKQFTVDAARWELTGVDGYLQTDCTAQPGICSAAAQQVCAEGQCFGRCDAEGTGTCELLLVVALWQQVDLRADNRELQSIHDQPIIDVTIDAIEYEVTENSLNLATPTFTIYAAPSTIMSPGDPEARPIATIPPVEPATLVPLREVAPVEGGRERLRQFMGDFRTPFNIIVGAELTVGAGDTIPDGALTARVQVRAHAGL